jgi:hypothetical protein
MAKKGKKPEAAPEAEQAKPLTADELQKEFERSIRAGIFPAHYFPEWAARFRVRIGTLVRERVERRERAPAPKKDEKAVKKPVKGEGKRIDRNPALWSGLEKFLKYAQQKLGRSQPILTEQQFKNLKSIKDLQQVLTQKLKAAESDTGVWEWLLELFGLSSPQTLRLNNWSDFRDKLQLTKDEDGQGRNTWMEVVAPMVRSTPEEPEDGSHLPDEGSSAPDGPDGDVRQEAAVEPGSQKPEPSKGQAAGGTPKKAEPTKRSSPLKPAPFIRAPAADGSTDGDAPYEGSPSGAKLLAYITGETDSRSDRRWDDFIAAAQRLTAHPIEGKHPRQFTARTTQLEMVKALESERKASSEKLFSTAAKTASELNKIYSTMLSVRNKDSSYSNRIGALAFGFFIRTVVREGTNGRFKASQVLPALRELLSGTNPKMEDLAVILGLFFEEETTEVERD